MLILREVLGLLGQGGRGDRWRPRRASVNSALQRARKTVDDRLPEQSQQATLRALGDDGLRELVDAYVDAWERGDVEAVVEMLTEDAAFAMPPLQTWFGGREEIAIFLARWPMSGTVALDAAAGAAPTASRRSPSTRWDDDEGRYMPVRAQRAHPPRRTRSATSTAFIIRSTPVDPDPETIARMPEQPTDAAPARRSRSSNFGLPERLSDPH